MTMSLEKLEEILSEEISEVRWYIEKDKFVTCSHYAFTIFFLYFNIADGRIEMSYGYNTPFDVIDDDIKVESIRKSFFHLVDIISEISYRQHIDLQEFVKKHNS